MKVAFIHYHLKPGGVTTVIRQQVEALAENGDDSLVFAGEPPTAAFPAETIPVPGLGYSQGAAAPPEKSVAGKIAAAIANRWPGGCDAVHVHNATLAKNIHLPGILDALREKGLRLLVQIHDFAEDGRPGAYSRAAYPENCHYCVINSRDHRILLKAGLKKEGLHLLPNMVSPIETVSTRRPETPFVLYPVRAIRRKNIGEAILLSLFFKAGHRLAITLPPNSPVDKVAYEDWVSFSKKHQLRVRFEAGLKDDFPTLASTARSFLTTSINEGFGFSFLESWTAGKSILGRKLPDICSDFEASGIELGHMYSRLAVPVTWFDLDGFIDSWRKAIEAAGRKFAREIPPADISAAEARLAGSTEIDFGLLNEKYQREVLLGLLENPEKKIALKQMNPFLEGLEDIPVPEDRIERNRKVVLNTYDAKSYRNMLGSIYRCVADKTVRHGIRKDALLSRFFTPDRLSLLKWGAYER
jgi:hypothetical protein